MQKADATPRKSDSSVEGPSDTAKDRTKAAKGNLPAVAGGSLPIVAKANTPKTTTRRLSDAIAAITAPAMIENLSPGSNRTGMATPQAGWKPFASKKHSKPKAVRHSSKNASTPSVQAPSKSKRRREQRRRVTALKQVKLATVQSSRKANKNSSTSSLPEQTITTISSKKQSPVKTVSKTPAGKDDGGVRAPGEDRSKSRRKRGKRGGRKRGGRKNRDDPEVYHEKTQRISKSMDVHQTKPAIFVIPSYWEPVSFFDQLSGILCRNHGYKHIRVIDCNEARNHAERLRGCPCTMLEDILYIRQELLRFVEEAAKTPVPVLVIAHGAGGYLAQAAIKGLTFNERRNKGMVGGVARIVFLAAEVLYDGEVPRLHQNVSEWGIDLALQTDAAAALFNDCGPGTEANFIQEELLRHPALKTWACPLPLSLDLELYFPSADAASDVPTPCLPDANAGASALVELPSGTPPPTADRSSPIIDDPAIERTGPLIADPDAVNPVPPVSAKQSLPTQQVRPFLSQHYPPPFYSSIPLVSQNLPPERFLPQNTRLPLHGPTGPFSFVQPCAHALRGGACQHWGIPSWDPALTLFSPKPKPGAHRRETLFHPVVPAVAPGWKLQVPNVHWVVPEQAECCAPASYDQPSLPTHQQHARPKNLTHPLPTRPPVSPPPFTSAVYAIVPPLVQNARLSTVPIRPHEAPIKLPIRTLYLLCPEDRLIPAKLQERYALRLGLARLHAKARSQARMQEEAISVARELDETGVVAEAMSQVRVPADSISPSQVQNEMRVLEGAGHLPHLACPEVLAEAVKSFAEEKVAFVEEQEGEGDQIRAR